MTIGSPTAPTAAAGRRRRRSRALGALVALTTTVALGLLAWTLVTVETITSGFHDAQIEADMVANVQRELLMVKVEVSSLHHTTGADLALRRGLLLRQVSNVEARLGQSDQEAARMVARIRALDWAALENLPTGPERAAVIEGFEAQLKEVEREYKAFYDHLARYFYLASAKSLEAKSNSQRVLGTLLVFTVVLAAAWAVTARRRSRNDLTQAYDALRISEERARAVIDTASDAFVSWDEVGRVTDWNQQSELLFGWTRDEALGRSVTEMICDEGVLNGTPGQRMALPAQARDGRQFPVEVTTWHLDQDGVFRFNAFIEDTSDRRRLEAELRHAQKLESVGQLAAGIAHEINTPIQFIGDNVRFLGDAFDEFVRALDGHLPADPGSSDLPFLVAEVPSAVEQTLEGVDRVATIVRAMKAFGHPSGEQKAAADLNEAVRNTLVVANNELKYVADVVTDLGDLPPVWCHLGDINQVVLNLVVNAAHAIGDVVTGTGGRGTITVRTRADGDHVTIDIADTGTGIPPDIAERVFEPFFTTKDVGAGTGQGLALAYSLVTERHHGRLTFTTQPGTGTTFTVHLPIRAPALALTP